MKHLSDAPTPVLVLSFAGLIPFIGGAFALALGGPAAIQSAVGLPVYAAVILSFLAGGRWAGEIILRADAPRTGVLLLSVILALSGWLAVLIQVWNRPGLPLDAELAGWLILMGGFAVSYLWDRSAARGATYPKWYAPMRLVLTIVVILCLAAAAALRAL